MRALKPAILSLLVLVAALPLFADPETGEPGTPLVNVEETQSPDQDAAPTERTEDARACVSPEVMAVPGATNDSLPVNLEENPPMAAGGGGVCACSENCCTGCPGVCCLEGGEGACSAVASCYRLDCPS